MKLFIVDSRDGEVVSLKALPREIERHYPQETQRQDLRDVMTNHWCKQEMLPKVLCMAIQWSHFFLICNIRSSKRIIYTNIKELIRFTGPFSTKGRGNTPKI